MAPVVMVAVVEAMVASAVDPLLLCLRVCLGETSCPALVFNKIYSP